MRDERGNKMVTVLIVEDDEVDVRTYMRGFKAERIANPTVIAKDGVEALEILRGENGQEKLPRPYIILLDLNMPRMGGLELLDEIRSDDELKDSVVFVLTTSKAEEDKLSAYRSHVAGYMVKSEVGPAFVEALKMLGHFWTVVVLP